MHFLKVCFGALSHLRSSFDRISGRTEYKWAHDYGEEEFSQMGLWVLKRKNLPLPFKVLLAGVRIKSTWDRLTGQANKAELHMYRESTDIDSKDNQGG